MSPVAQMNYVGYGATQSVHKIGEGTGNGPPDELGPEYINLGCSIGGIAGFPYDLETTTPFEKKALEDLTPENIEKACPKSFCRAWICAVSDKQSLARKKLEEAGWTVLGVSAGGHPQDGPKSAKAMYLMGRGFENRAGLYEMVASELRRDRDALWKENNELRKKVEELSKPRKRRTNGRVRKFKASAI